MTVIITMGEVFSQIMQTDTAKTPDGGDGKDESNPMWDTGVAKGHVATGDLAFNKRSKKSIYMKYKDSAGVYKCCPYQAAVYPEKCPNGAHTEADIVAKCKRGTSEMLESGEWKTWLMITVMCCAVAFTVYGVYYISRTASKSPHHNTKTKPEINDFSP